MKKILILILLTLMFPIIVEAKRPRPRPTVTPTVTPTVIPTIIPTPVVSGNRCINYGHQEYPYNMDNVRIDADNILLSGINCVRTAYSDWNDLELQKIASYFKSRGFRVIFGGGWWTTLKSTNLASYKTKALSGAVWANQAGIDQFSLGNEQEYRLGITKDQWYTFLVGLAVEVRKVYSGKISYETSGDFADYWSTKTLQGVDMLGLNLYCGYACNLNYLNKNITKHGLSRVYISETNADMMTGLYGNDQVHADELKGDYVKLLQVGVPIYYFNYEACNNTYSVPNAWGLYLCNVLAQPLSAQVVGIK